MQIDPSLGTVNSDSTKLRQCLLNLGSNACKFTEKGHVFILARAEGDDLVFSVSDTGIGMTPDEIDQLFQPFMQGDNTTTRKYGGTGLGLAITHNFVAMMGGAIGPWAAGSMVVERRLMAGASVASTAMGAEMAS